jgi:vacuolar fusion protein MON1
MPNYDLRNLLGGTEIFLDALADTMIKADPGILLGSLEVSKLRKSTREKINTALLNARHEDLLYGMIVAEGRLVSVIRPRRHSLHPPGPPPSHPHNHVRYGN